jgi:hypothetical protein
VQDCRPVIEYRRTSDAVDLLHVDLDLNIGFGSLSTGAVLRMSTITP